MTDFRADFRASHDSIPARADSPAAMPAAPDREYRLAHIMRAEAESRMRRDNEGAWREGRLKRMLRDAGLRPTRQRLALAGLLFSEQDRHLTAENLHAEAVAANLDVSLATVYNTLHQFAQVGLLREIGVEGTKLFFDTNPSAHHHFVVEGGEALFDIPDDSLVLNRLPSAPEGYTVARVDLIVRLRRKTDRAGRP